MDMINASRYGASARTCDQTRHEIARRSLKGAAPGSHIYNGSKKCGHTYINTYINLRHSSKLLRSGGISSSTSFRKISMRLSMISDTLYPLERQYFCITLYWGSVSESVRFDLVWRFPGEDPESFFASSFIDLSPIRPLYHIRKEISIKVLRTYCRMY
jgi:hypothetical protein